MEIDWMEWGKMAGLHTRHVEQEHRSALLSLSVKPIWEKFPHHIRARNKRTCTHTHNAHAHAHTHYAHACIHTCASAHTRTRMCA